MFCKLSYHHCYFVRGISTPTRSLTPDPRVAMMEPGLQSTSYVDMSPASRASPAPIAGLSCKSHLHFIIVSFFSPFFVAMWKEIYVSLS